MLQFDRLTRIGLLEIRAIHQTQAMLRIAILMAIAGLATGLIFGVVLVFTRRQLSITEAGVFYSAVLVCLFVWDRYLTRHRHARRKLDEMRDSALW